MDVRRRVTDHRAEHLRRGVRPRHRDLKPVGRRQGRALDPHAGLVGLHEVGIDRREVLDLGDVCRALEARRALLHPHAAALVVEQERDRGRQQPTGRELPGIDRDGHLSLGAGLEIVAAVAGGDLDHAGTPALHRFGQARAVGHRVVPGHLVGRHQIDGGERHLDWPEGRLTVLIDESIRGIRTPMPWAALVLLRVEQAPGELELGKRRHDLAFAVLPDRLRELREAAPVESLGEWTGAAAPVALVHDVDGVARIDAHDRRARHRPAPARDLIVVDSARRGHSLAYGC